MHGMLNQWPVEVGEWVTVGHNVTLHGCVVEDRCLIGMGVIILNGARIGAGSIIAAGTLIPEETVIPPGSLVMGVPGKVRKQLGDDEQQTILRYAKNYLGYKETYLAERKWNWSLVASRLSAPIKARSRVSAKSGLVREKRSSH